MRKEKEGNKPTHKKRRGGNAEGGARSHLAELVGGLDLLELAGLGEVLRSRGATKKGEEERVRGRPRARQDRPRGRRAFRTKVRREGNGRRRGAPSRARLQLRREGLLPAGGELVVGADVLGDGRQGGAGAVLRREREGWGKKKREEERGGGVQKLKLGRGDGRARGTGKGAGSARAGGPRAGRGGARRRREPEVPEATLGRA